MEVGKLLLSPTMTFAPVMKVLLEEHFDDIHGLVHCSGGGQTKCLKFIPNDVLIIKDNLHPVPPIFELIQEASGADDKEMYQVFNMGTRMEIYTSKNAADKIIAISNSFGIAAQIIGRLEPSEKKELHIHTGKNRLVF